MAERVVDWAEVATLARRHRVVGFVAAAIGEAGLSIDPAVQSRLTVEARRNTERNLRNLGEEGRIDSALRDAGVEPVFLKGTALGLRLYGSLSIKTSWDIDVLVDPADVTTANAVMASLGYRPELPGWIDPAAIDAYSAGQKDVVWYNADRETSVELHRLLTGYASVLPGVGARSPRRMVAAGGARSVATLADPEHYAYLCTHGALHGWARLKWLADVDALIAVSDLGATALHERASALGAGRASAVALALREACFGGAPLGSGDSRLVRHLTRLSARMIADRGASDDAAFDRPGNTMRQLWLAIIAGPGWRSAVEAGWTLATRRRWRGQRNLPAPFVAVSTAVIGPLRLIRQSMGK